MKMDKAVYEPQRVKDKRIKNKDLRIMELEVILEDTKIFLKTIGTLKPLVVDNCKRLIKKIENAGI